MRSKTSGYGAKDAPNPTYGNFRGEFMTIDISQFYQVFFEEAAEHLAGMEALLLGLDVSNPSMDDLNAIFRAAHSVKGGAGTFGFNDMTEVTHILENLLDRLRKQEMTLTDEMVNVFLEAKDVIAMQLAAHRGEGTVEQGDVETVCKKLERLVSDGTAGHLTNFNSAVGSQTSSPHAGVPPALLVQPKEEAYGFFDELPTPTPAAEEQADPGYGFFDESFDEILDKPPVPQEAAVVPVAQNPGRRASDAPDAEGLRTGQRGTDKVAMSAQAEATSIRVSVEKVDQLINLVGELVITQAMLAQSATHDGAVDEQMQNGLRQLDRNTRDIQEAVMSMRMLPISFVFSRYPRLVRDLAAKLGKQIELKTIGETTELDKGLVEKIADPLTHLVRNSLDHGIESPDKRIAAGKPAKGTITLQAFHQGGNIIIEVADDGAGLNRVKLLEKARERGLALRDEMSDQEVWMLIFEPGFSTAEVVTDVSGRGVGMDVVRRNIAELGGRIELDSALGVGTRTTIRLPLTLAILDGLSVLVGQETYIVPLGSIIESLQVNAADLKSVSGSAERLLRVRGEYLPLLALHEVFNTKPAANDLEKSIVVIVESEGKKTALLVDELLGQLQVVIKSLETNYRKVHGISGATIMGDGRVALILDVAVLGAQHAARAKMTA